MISSTEPAGAGRSPGWGRPSPASEKPWALRPDAAAGSAAIRADGGDGRRWIVRAVSLSGVGHRLAGEGPQDAYAWELGGDRLVVAVADGVSNSAGSAAGATAAVTAAVANPRRPVAAAAEAVLAAGGSTTLVVAVLDADGVVIVQRVGDSSAFVLSGVDWREVWAAGADDGLISTATVALPGDAEGSGDGTPATLRLAPTDTLVLVTDGVANPLRDGPTTVAPCLAEGLASPPAPLELARLLDFSRQGCHDDRTLVAIWSV